MIEYLCMVALHMQCCGKYKPSTVKQNIGRQCLHSFVIVKHVSHDKHISAWLLIISNVVQQINLVLQNSLLWQYCIHLYVIVRYISH